MASSGAAAAGGDASLAGRVALVTGSVDGIGHAALRALAQRGCRVMMHGLADPALAEARRAEVEAACGVPVAFHGADLADPAQVEALHAATVAGLGGPIDILVNNAVTRNFSAIEDLPFERWSHALAVNLSAPFRLMQLTLPGMKQRGWGRIVNIASNWGLTGTVNRVDYVSTKHALIGLTRAAAQESAAFGVTCNAVCPGAVMTPNSRRTITERMATFGQSWDEAVKDFLKNRGPSGRFIEPEKVGALIAFLCGPDASEMTGSPILMDGGWRAM